MLKIGRGAAAPPFMVMDVIAAANARQATLAPNEPHVIRMEVGQPGTGAPAGAVEAVATALRSGLALGYTEAFGRQSLRERIAAHIRDWYKRGSAGGADCCDRGPPRARFRWRSLPRSTPVIGSRWRRRSIRRTSTS